MGLSSPEMNYRSEEIAGMIDPDVHLTTLGIVRISPRLVPE
jgi:hypothetical protein